MCRLCGFSFTNYPEYKAQWLDRLMLVSQTDESQNDGWGVTDGVNLWKSEHMYSASNPTWIKEIHPAESWLTHVRKASAGTGKTNLEAHPYKFLIKDSAQEFWDLYCAHNGRIDGTAWRQGADIPNTDSYRAFLELTSIMNRDGHSDLTAELFGQWLSGFTDSSQLAMLFLYKGNLVALRKERPLHYCRLGNGYVVHTSSDVLEIFRRYLREINGIEVGTTIEIPQNHMVVFPTSCIDIVQSDVKINMRAYWSNTAKNVDRPVTTPLLTANSTELRGACNTIPVTPVPKDIVYSTSVTRPKKERNVAKNTVVDLDSATRLSLMAEITNRLSPVRQNLIWFWMLSNLGYGASLSSASTEDLALWLTMLPRLSYKKDNNTIIRPYTSRQYMLINQWNHVICRGKDHILHDAWLGNTMFWTLPRYTAPLNDSAAQNLLVADIASFTAANDLFDCWSLSTDVLERALSKEGDFDISKLQ